MYSYRGLSVFVCCSVSLQYLAFVSLLLLSMMLCRQLSPRPFAASQCSDPQNQHNICVNHDQLLMLVPHKYLLKLSSCPLQFSLFCNANKDSFSNIIERRWVTLKFLFDHFLPGILRCFKGFISGVISLLFPLSCSVFSWRLKLEFSFVFFRDFKSFPFGKWKFISNSVGLSTIVHFKG